MYWADNDTNSYRIELKKEHKLFEDEYNISLCGKLLATLFICKK